MSAPGASANGVGWSPSRVGCADNRAKHAARSACSAGGRLVPHGVTRARAARHGTRKRRLRWFEAAFAELVQCRRRRTSANGVGWSASRVGRADNRAKHAARRGECSVGGISPSDKARRRTRPACVTGLVRATSHQGVLILGHKNPLFTLHNLAFTLTEHFTLHNR